MKDEIKGCILIIFGLIMFLISLTLFIYDYNNKVDRDISDGFGVYCYDNQTQVKYVNKMATYESWGKYSVIGINCSKEVSELRK